MATERGAATRAAKRRKNAAQGASPGYRRGINKALKGRKKGVTQAPKRMHPKPCIWNLGSDPNQDLSQRLILLRQNRSQIEQYPPFFDPRNHWRIRGAQPGRKLVSA
jgi:hypothetical protein